MWFRSRDRPLTLVGLVCLPISCTCTCLLACTCPCLLSRTRTRICPRLPSRSRPLLRLPAGTPRDDLPPAHPLQPHPLLQRPRWGLCSRRPRTLLSRPSSLLTWPLPHRPRRRASRSEATRHSTRTSATRRCRARARTRCLPSTVTGRTVTPLRRPRTALCTRCLLALPFRLCLPHLRCPRQRPGGCGGHGSDLLG